MLLRQSDASGFFRHRCPQLFSVFGTQHLCILVSAKNISFQRQAHALILGMEQDPLQLRQFIYEENVDLRAVPFIVLYRSGEKDILPIAVLHGNAVIVSR